MIDYKALEKYSIPLEQQMKQIANMAWVIDAAMQKASQICQDPEFIEDANRTFGSIGGKPGDGALEMYRDLEDNIWTMKAFLERHQNQKERPGYSDVIGQAEKLLAELSRLNDLVKHTPPEIMTEIKAGISRIFYNRESAKGVMATDEEKYDFKGSSLVMFVSFGAVILLRFFEVITLSWYIVIPIALATMVIVPAMISTLRFVKRGT